MKAIIGSALATLLAVVVIHAQLSAEEMQSADMHLYSPTAIEWKAAPAALPPGARMAVLEGDPTKEGPFVVRFQFPDGYHVPPHTHPKTERVTVISGILHLATGEASRSHQREKTSCRVLRLLARRHETHRLVRRRDCHSTPRDWPMADQLRKSRR